MPKKNKIGIATWYKSENYGTCLQAYALNHYIKEHGFEPFVLGRIRGFYNAPFRINWLVSKVKQRIRYKKRIKDEGASKCKIHSFKKQERIEKFTKTYFNVFNLDSKFAWEELNSSFHCFISGGDQIWNPNYIDHKFLLDFIWSNKKIKKISYASSVGVKKLPLIDEPMYKKYWLAYDGLSVREDSAAKIIKQVANIDSVVVLDSTLLLKDKDWNNLADTSEIKIREPYVLCYFVGDNAFYWDYVKSLEKQFDYKVLVIRMHENCGGYQFIDDAGPKEFIELIRNAKIVVTDSFHGSVFCIRYHKEFYVLKRFNDCSKYSQNDRIHYLLSLCGLDKQLVENKLFERKKEIDYDKVEEILNLELKKSEAFLSQYI